MNFTLHLTNRCNLDCRYCFEHRTGFSAHEPSSMSLQTAIAAVDLMHKANHPRNGFALFGGEPMLEREVLYGLVSYVRSLGEAFSDRFDYKMTTNGLLLDEEFLQFAGKSRIEISLSHDGLMHDFMRVYPNGSGSSSDLLPKIELLLLYQPRALAMCTVTPQTVSLLADSVIWLADHGFRRIVTTIDYRPHAGWDENSMAELCRQYELLGQQYSDRFGTDKAFQYVNFEEKIKHHILGNRYCADQCHLGKKQPSVDVDGTIYPCVQFVGDPAYAMGNVFEGIDITRQQQVYESSFSPITQCEGCELQPRCTNHCCCLNYQLTGQLSTVSPVQCAHERNLIAVADTVASRLFQAKTEPFVHYFYT